jgi:hypothetical protein
MTIEEIKTLKEQYLNLLEELKEAIHEMTPENTDDVQRADALLAKVQEMKKLHDRIHGITSQ